MTNLLKFIFVSLQILLTAKIYIKILIHISVSSLNYFLTIVKKTGKNLISWLVKNPDMMFPNIVEQLKNYHRMGENGKTSRKAQRISGNSSLNAEILQ